MEGYLLGAMQGGKLDLFTDKIKKESGNTTIVTQAMAATNAWVSFTAAPAKSKCLARHKETQTYLPLLPSFLSRLSALKYREYTLSRKSLIGQDRRLTTLGSTLAIYIYMEPFSSSSAAASRQDTAKEKPPSRNPAFSRPIVSKTPVEWRCDVFDDRFGMPSECQRNIPDVRTGVFHGTVVP